MLVLAVKIREVQLPGGRHFVAIDELRLGPAYNFRVHKVKIGSIGSGRIFNISLMLRSVTDLLLADLQESLRVKEHGLMTVVAGKLG